MKKLMLKVSGARVGDDVRPVADAPAIVVAKAPRFGLRAHQAIVVKPAAPIAREDYATLEDYER